MKRHVFSTLALAAVVVASLACTSGSATPSPTPAASVAPSSGQALGVASDTTLPANATVTSALAGTPFSFPSGVALFGTTGDTTVTFTGSASSPAFTIASGGNSATGTLSFGSCLFAVTAASGPLGNLIGQTIRLNPCNIRVGTSGILANGVALSRLVALILGDATSSSASATVSVNGSGELTLNGQVVGTLTLTPLSALGTPTPSPAPTVTPTATPTATTTATPTATAAATESPAPTPTQTAAATATPTQTVTSTPTPIPTPTPTPIPTPTPTPTPTPPSAGVPGGVPNASGPVPPGFVRYNGTVVDASTGTPIRGVCVYSGPPAGCPTQGTPRTDASGYFAIDYPAGATFLWTFEHPDYRGLLSQPIAGGTNATFRLTHN